MYVYVVGWLVRSTCLQGGAVYFENGGKGTFTNCNFISNSAVKNSVSLEEEHADCCEMSQCMTLRLCPPCVYSMFSTDSFLLPLSVHNAGVDLSV